MDWNTGFHWVFDKGAPGLCVIFLIACVVLDAMNHQFLWDKIRNTVLFMGLFGGLGSGFFVYLQYTNGTPERTSITVVAVVSLATTITLANWFVYGVYKLGHLDQGERGEIKRAVENWMKLRIASIQGWVATVIAMFIVAITLGACTLVVPTDPPDPLWMTIEASNTQLAQTATAAVPPTPTATVTVTPSPSVTSSPTATFTSGICELPTLGPGTFVLEVSPCP